jgi:hypothetical protein
MPTTRGFFSIVQFCPDLDRGECANVGVVLVVPNLGFVDVRFGSDNEAPKRRFGADAFDDARLTLAKRTLEGRIRAAAGAWTTAEELERFSRLEGNHLVLSKPRVILVEDPRAEIEDLYTRLVHVDAIQRNRVRQPDLKTLFEPKLKGVPLRKNVKVTVPVFGELTMPYAYQNGRLNLIRAEAFPHDEKSATSKATDLAVKGHLLHAHPEAPGMERQLIVVGGFDGSATDAFKGKMSLLLREHDARLVLEEQLDAFVEEVRRDAHN